MSQIDSLAQDVGEQKKALVRANGSRRKTGFRFRTLKDNRMSRAQKRHFGVVVPMVTPITAAGALDEPAVARILAHLSDGGVHGVFVLGTTGEGRHVPPPMRERLVKLVAGRINGHMRLYAGISSDSMEVSVHAGNSYFDLGADAVVAHAPNHYEPRPGDCLQYFCELASNLRGDLIIYNMPLTTNVSLPIDVCKQTAQKPRIAGIKDSENNADRLGRLLQELGGQASFSVFVGVGALMAKGLLQGADGIVPSVGNLAPALCRQFYDSVVDGNTKTTALLHERLMAIAAIYQSGRNLGESLAALKAAMCWMGLCEPHVFAQWKSLDEAELAALRVRLLQLQLPVRDLHGTRNLSSGSTQVVPAINRASAFPRTQREGQRN
jgi:4-hydroxy-tetrahydrodipicolinate synthase